MTDNLNSSVSETSELRPPLPTQVKVVAYGNLIVGPLLAIVNMIVVGSSISALNARNAPDGLTSFFYASIAIYVLVGLLFLAGGVGLVRKQKWGRVVSLIAAGSCFVAVFAGIILGAIGRAMLQSGALPLQPGQTSFYLNEPIGVGMFAPAYGILVIVLLMLPDARKWAGKGIDTAPLIESANTPQSTVESASGSTVAGSATVPVAKTSPLAIASLVCSMVPFMMLTQISAFVLGIVALTQIKKSNGALGGKGFAIAGMIISSVLILFAGFIIFVIVVPNSR